MGHDSSWISDITYPFITSANAKAAAAANLSLSDNLFGTGTGLDKKSIAQVLGEAASEHLVSLTYEITFESEKLLSVTVTSEHMGAYPSTSKDYFVFDRQTGKNYYLSEFIDPGKHDTFEDIIRAALIDSFRVAYNEAVRFMDSTELPATKQFLDQCGEDLHGIRILRGMRFYLSDGILMIPSDCDFPHAWKALEPIFSVPFPASAIKELLQPWVYKQLISKGRRK